MLSYFKSNGLKERNRVNELRAKRDVLEKVHGYEKELAHIKRRLKLVERNKNKVIMSVC